MYLLIGRTEDYAWSLTSANQDVRDVYAEVLCEPDGSAPTRTSTHYEYDGGCIPFDPFDAGTLSGEPIRYPVSVHGPVIGTALSEGRPVALTRKRSTFGRDGLNLAALKDMTEGDADTPEAFWEVANKFGFTFNWGYANRDGIGYFASGYLPERAAGPRPAPPHDSAPATTSGRVSSTRTNIPTPTDTRSGMLLNWNNQSAPGFMHGDGNQYGAWHRVENFDQWPTDDIELADVVSVMNRAATEDTRAPVWPTISDVLRGGDAPSPLAGEVADLMDAWIADDAPRLDADDDGDHDRAGPLLIDELWDPLADAVLDPCTATRSTRSSSGASMRRRSSTRTSARARPTGRRGVQPLLLRRRRSRRLPRLAVGSRSTPSPPSSRPIWATTRPRGSAKAEGSASPPT